jgi:hypothetical protein
MKRVIVLALAVLLTGCAVCQRHPDGCAIAATAVVGAAILAVGVAQWNNCSVIGQRTYAPPCARRK